MRVESRFGGLAATAFGGGLWWQTRRPVNLLEDLAHPELIDPSAFDTQRFSPGSFYLKTKGKVEVDGSSIFRVHRKFDAPKAFGTRPADCIHKE